MIRRTRWRRRAEEQVEGFGPSTKPAFLFPGAAVFRVEFTVHLAYDKGITSFRREEQLPFVPFVGLDILDDVLGQFQLKWVAWHTGSQMFLCQSQVERKNWSIRQACRSMSKAKWKEDHETRESGGSFGDTEPSKDG